MPFKPTWVYVNQLTFAKHRRMGTGCQRSQPCDWRWNFSAPACWPRGRGHSVMRLNQLLMADDVINQVYVTKPHKAPEGWGLERFWVGEYLEVWGECSLRESMAPPCTFHILYPTHLVHLAVSELYPFIISNLIIKMILNSVSHSSKLKKKGANP